MPELYKIMLMSCGLLWMAACWSWACVAGRYMERAQWDSAFLLRKTSRHLMMNSLSPNVPLFCVENMSAFLNDFGEPGMAHVVGGGWEEGESLCSRLWESIKASTDNYKLAERRDWLIVRCSMLWAQPRGLSSTPGSFVWTANPVEPHTSAWQSHSESNKKKSRACAHN